MSRDAKSLIICAAALAAAISCADPALDAGPAEPAKAATDAPEPKKSDPAVDAVNALSDRLDEKVRGAVEGAMTAEASRAWLEDGKPKKHRPDTLGFRAELTALYAETDLGLVRNGALTQDGERIKAALADAGSHGLDTKPYHGAALDKALADLAAAQTLTQGQSEFSLRPEARTKVIELARSLAEPSEDALVTALLADGTPAPELKKAADAYRGLLSQRAKAAAKVEVLLADGLMAYAWDLKYANRAWFPDEEYPKRESPNPVLRARLAKDLASARGPKLGPFVEGLAPRFVQYERLRAALARYREVQAEGAWKKVGRIPGAKKGRRNKSYIALKKRLAAEGFYTLSAEPTDVFDDALDKGIRRYQESHQLAVDGEPNRWFWMSLDTPLAERIQQIEINLRRWRESRIAHDDYYIHVNLPDFHAEIWRGGKLEYRYRIIVGNRTIACDRDEGRIRRVNATPLFSDAVEMVIMNPYWNVPERIFKEEIIPEMIKSPTYLADENFECMATDETTGLCTRVRQGSGEKNALGQVKFIFPNEHGVYMHDTEKKRLFDLPIRAFSHGCMRVHEPLKLAEKILGNDGQWDKDEVDKILGHGKEQGIRLKTPVPIHIEYYTVRVDDEDNVHFLADIYRYDREIITGESSVGAKCEPEPLAELELEPESQPDSAPAEGVDGAPTDAAPEDGAPRLKVIGDGLTVPGGVGSKPKFAFPQARKLGRAVENAAKAEDDDGQEKIDDIGP